MPKKEKPFSTIKKNLAKYILSLKTKEELDAFLSQLSAKYVQMRAEKTFGVTPQMVNQFGSMLKGMIKGSG